MSADTVANETAQVAPLAAAETATGGRDWQEMGRLARAACEAQVYRTADRGQQTAAAQMDAAEAYRRWVPPVWALAAGTIAELEKRVAELEAQLTELVNECTFNGPNAERLRDALIAGLGAPGTADPVKLYAFTFGVGHRNHDCFVKIEAANEVEARLRMIDVYGRAWSSVYPWDDFVSQIAQYGYVELPFGEDAR